MSPLYRNCDGSSRRDFLRLGLGGLLGLGLTDLLQLRAQARPAAAKGKDVNCIMIWMDGGPSHYETFDPKPDAPSEIRGTFKPIATSVPGTRFCELLPRTARLADKLCVGRSMWTGDPNHESGGYWVNTGHRYGGPNMRATHPTDWPTF